MMTQSPVPSRRTIGRTRRRIYAAMAVVLSLASTAAALELALRLYHGQLTRTSNLRARRIVIAPISEAVHDERLGYIPRPNARISRYGRPTSIDADGLRLNSDAPRTPVAPGEAILVVGDSFTFGDEVADDETWPAHLQRELNRPVLNAGVFGYGLDQMVLRAEQLLPHYEPRLLIVAFIDYDIMRCELSCAAARKPYFEIDQDGALSLRNTPVPPPTAAEHVARPIEHSFLARAVLSRAAPQWWYEPGRVREHDRGAEVARLLLLRARDSAAAHGADLLVIGLRHRRQRDDSVTQLLQFAAEHGIATLDLTGPISDELAGGRIPRQQFFAARGHYSPQANAWVASRIAEYLYNSDPTAWKVDDF